MEHGFGFIDVTEVILRVVGIFCTIVALLILAALIFLGLIILADARKIWRMHGLGHPDMKKAADMRAASLARNEPEWLAEQYAAEVAFRPADDIPTMLIGGFALIIICSALFVAVWTYALGPLTS